jgi:hypothetical protein
LEFARIAEQHTSNSTTFVRATIRIYHSAHAAAEVESDIGQSTGGCTPAHTVALLFNPHGTCPHILIQETLSCGRDSATFSKPLQMANFLDITGFPFVKRVKRGDRFAQAAMGCASGNNPSPE